MFCYNQFCYYMFVLVICSLWLESLLFLDYNFHLRLFFLIQNPKSFLLFEIFKFETNYQGFLYNDPFLSFLSFSIKCRQPLGPAVVEVVVATAAPAAVAGGAVVVVVVVWKVSLDGLERWGKPFTLNPVGHEERVLDHDPALSAG